MVNYENGKIYKLEADGLIYIGSTTKQYLCQRLETHYRDFKSFQNGKLKTNISSFELFKNGTKPVITLIELAPCKSKDELMMRERFHIENTICVNKIKKVTLTEEERKNYGKDYKENNKDKIKEINKKWRNKNKDNLKEINKEWRQNNKDKIKEINKNYRNKHIIKENITNNILKKYKFIILFKKVKSINEVYKIQNYF